VISLVTKPARAARCLRSVDVTNTVTSSLGAMVQLGPPGVQPPPANPGNSPDATVADNVTLVPSSNVPPLTTLLV
jgi:hypothetical protein